MLERSASFCLAVILCCVATSAIAQSPDSAVTDRPKVGLVLGGGGAQGVAHLGVLKELERQRVPVDFVVGTGFGGIIGGLYASGLTVEEIETFLFDNDWVGIFNPDTQRQDLSFRRKRDDDDFLIKFSVGVRDGQAQLPTALIPNKRFSQVLQSSTAHSKGTTDFDLLPVPYRAVAMDLLTGEEVVLGSGSLDRAILATFSSPGTLAPVQIDGRTLISGSLINNLPVDVAREWGADVLIVVDVGVFVRGEDELNSIFAIANQVDSLLQKRNTRGSLNQLTPADIVIQPQVTPFRATEVADPEVNVRKGAEAVAAMANRLAHVSLDDAAFAQINSDRISRTARLPVITDIELRNDTRVSDSVILAQISQPLNEELDKNALEEDLRKVLGIGAFSAVDFNIRTEGEAAILELHAKENRAGNRFWRFGISLQDDLEGNSAYTGSASMTWTNLNSYGGEWRNVFRIGEQTEVSSEFYQPLVKSGRYFSSLAASYTERNVNSFVDGNIEGQSRVKEFTGRLTAGRIFGNSGQVQLGLIRGRGSSEGNIGSNIPSGDFDVGGYLAAAAYDTYDNVHFPKHGTTAVVSWLGQRESVGASFDVDLVTGRVGFAKTWDTTTFIGGATVQSQLNEVAGVQNLVTTGGLFNLSGFQRDELSGRHTFVGRAILYRQLRTNPLRGFLNASLYFGGSLEIGNAWQQDDDVSFGDTITAGSLFLGADTFIGPVYLAGGYAEGGNSALYLYVGRPF